MTGTGRDRIGLYRYGGVLLITLAVALFSLLAPDGSLARSVELVTAGVTLVIAVATSNAPAATRRASSIALAVAVVAVTLDEIFGAPHPTLSLAATGAVFGATALILLRGLIRLVMEHGVVLQAVLGALAVYVLLGLTFAFTIGAIAVGGSGSLLRPGHRRHPGRPRLLQLHRADHDRLRRLHRRHQVRPRPRRARDAHRPAVPGHRHLAAGRQPAPPREHDAARAPRAAARRRLTAAHPLRVTTAHPGPAYLRSRPTRRRTDDGGRARTWRRSGGSRVLGVVSLVCGVLALVYPGITLLALGVILGFYLILGGRRRALDAIMGDAASRVLSAIVGVLALIAGLVCLRRPGESLLALVVVLGISSS